MREAGYKKLVVWQKADELAYQVYLETKRFPKQEIYGIISQLRRAVLSVPTNLVEGTGRQGKKELRQFANEVLSKPLTGDWQLATLVIGTHRAKG